MKIGVVGCAGRMGQMLVREIDATSGCELAGGTEAPGHADVGKDIAALAGLAPVGIEISDDTEALFETSDAVIEFSLPEATTEHAQLAGDMATALVIGTTGLTPEQQETIAMAAEITPIFQSPNMAVGVNLMFALTERVAAVLGDDYDIEIIEMHHRHKVDAPSGTALALGQAAAKGRGVDLDNVAQRGRDGITGARKPGDIGFAALRGGDVVGEHTVIFASEGERLELTHRASSRVVFARGAVRAALWTAGQPPGLYSMKDMLRFD